MKRKEDDDEGVVGSKYSWAACGLKESVTCRKAKSMKMFFSSVSRV